MNVLIAWVIFVAATASVAKSKSRNVFLWAGIGALLGPFAIIIVALMEPAGGDESKHENRQ